MSPATDSWLVRRILVASILGAAGASGYLVLDFWPLGGVLNDHLRLAYELLFLLLFVVVAFVTLMVWLIRAILALFRARFRRMASILLATVAFPLSFSAALFVPLFDPWLWYVLTNKTALETLAKSHPALSSRKVVTLEHRDVSTGIAGVSSNHFVSLIYKENGALGGEAFGLIDRHIYGKFFRRDYFD